MIVAPGMFLLALALPARQPQDSVHIRGISRDTTLAVVSTSAGGALRADVVLPLIGGSVSSTSNGRWKIEAPGVSFTLVDGVPFATTKVFQHPSSDDSVAFTILAVKNGKLKLHQTVNKFI